MKIDKLYYRRVINNAKYLEFNTSQYFQLLSNQSDVEIIIEELEYLIKNDVYKKIVRISRKSFFGEYICIKRELERDFKLLEKYTTLFDSLKLWKLLITYYRLKKRIIFIYDFMWE